ncbi:uncharacterized protein LOC117757974 [Hippoglossus hippoglossus]|uniref:uncharacterized protein LOC117757974 n=1 Tax=Hippoglossus hippoglossus TaxID=8267 RepID=UPI00148E4E9A|nr:uncharacterized protein LOC117757974 [Hippoglossus hippoglossus]
MMLVRAAESHFVLELACFPWDPRPRCQPCSQRLSGAGEAARGATSHLPPHIWSSLPVPPHYPLPHQQHTDSSLLREEPSTTAPTSTETTTAAMDMSFCSPLQLQENSFLFESLLEKTYDPVAFDPALDPGYFSAGSSLSPTSSVDSFCFSPSSIQAAGNEQDVLDRFIFSDPEAPQLTHKTQTVPYARSSTATSATKKSRSRYPGKKRETASEREKLRMRDLTKALHHVRSYLPPSVVPAGQTLTKIDTLRLTMRYISYLSAQLGLSEEVLEQRRSPGFMEPPQTLCQFLGQPTASCSPQESNCNTMSVAQPSSLQHTYQVCSHHGYTAQKHLDFKYKTCFITNSYIRFTVVLLSVTAE